MKQILSCLIFIVASTAQAAVVDSFSCQLILKDLITGQETRQKIDFDVARRPLSQSPSPNVRLTAGSARVASEIDNNVHTMSVDFDISYDHALRDRNGRQEARQSVCLAVGHAYCPKAQNPSGPSSCMAMKSACLGPEDPFDSIYGWAPVPIVNGVPIFDERLLNISEGFIYESTTPIPPGNTPRPPSGRVGEYHFSCNYKGTLDN